MFHIYINDRSGELWRHCKDETAYDVDENGDKTLVETRGGYMG